MIEMDLFAHTQVGSFDARMQLGAEMPPQSHAEARHAAEVMECLALEVLCAILRGEAVAAPVVDPRQLAIPGAL